MTLGVLILSSTPRQTVADEDAIGFASLADEDDTVSVGRVGDERQIVNVEGGDLASGSTDAVNAGQLFRTVVEGGAGDTNTIQAGNAGVNLQIQDDSVTADDLATDSVGSAEIQVDAVGSSEIDDGSVFVLK